MAAEAALNKSLDDLIAEQRKKKDTQKTKKEIRKGNRPSGGGPPDRAPLRRLSGRSDGGEGGGGGRPAPRRNSEPRNLSITVRGGVDKRRSSGGLPGGPRDGPREEPLDRQDPEARAAALDGGAKWGHDLFKGPTGGGRRAAPGPRDATHLGTKLFISNLHYNVTDADIKELFETCGPLVQHTIHYDNSGRSEGTAEVVYKDAGHAERAMRRYSGVQLDGQAMEIELIPQSSAPVGGGTGGGPRTLSSGVRISGERGGTRMVQLTRSFQQAAGGAAARVRGRGSVRSGVTAMQE